MRATWGRAIRSTLAPAPLGFSVYGGFAALLAGCEGSLLGLSRFVRAGRGELGWSLGCGEVGVGVGVGVRGG
jgi:hypothetical protein